LKPSDELIRLIDGVVVGGVPVAVAEAADPELVLDRVRSVLEVVLVNSEGDWPSLSHWEVLLPEWFVLACAPEPTAEEADRWLDWWQSLPGPQRSEAAAAKPWTLSGWLYWLEPSNRTWFWSGAGFNHNVVAVELEVDSWPSAVGSLEWLLHTAGADLVQFP
jgi:hypothetical protein